MLDQSPLDNPRPLEHLMAGPIIYSEKDWTEFHQYLAENDEIWSLFKDKLSQYILRQAFLFERNLTSVAKKEEMYIKSLIHFMKSKKIVSAVKLVSYLNEVQTRVNQSIKALI